MAGSGEKPMVDAGELLGVKKEPEKIVESGTEQAIATEETQKPTVRRRARLPKMPNLKISPIKAEMDEESQKIFEFLNSEIAGDIREFTIDVKKRNQETGRYVYQTGEKTVFHPNDEDLGDLYNRIVKKHGGGLFQLTFKAPKKFGVPGETITIELQSIEEKSGLASLIESSTDGSVQIGPDGRAVDNNPLGQLLASEMSGNARMIVDMVMKQNETLQSNLASLQAQMIQMATAPKQVGQTPDPFAATAGLLNVLLPVITKQNQPVIQPAPQPTPQVNPMEQMKALIEMMSMLKGFMGTGEVPDAPAEKGLKEKAVDAIGNGVNTLVDTMARKIGEGLAPMATQLAIGGALGGGVPNMAQPQIAAPAPKPKMTPEELRQKIGEILGQGFAGLTEDAKNDEILGFYRSKLKPRIIVDAFSRSEDELLTAIREFYKSASINDSNVTDERIKNFITYMKEESAK